MPKFDVSVIGELNLDLIFYGLPAKLELDREHLATNLSLTLGSSSAIFAHNLARLGSTVGFSSSIGSDSLGPICIERLAEAKIDLTRVRRFDGKITGLTVILPQGKERYILTYPGTMADYSLADLDLKICLRREALHVASYFLQRAMQPSLEQIFREAKAAGLTTSLDTNDDPDDRWTPEIQKLFPHLDLLMPNEHEACRMAGVDDIEKAIEILSKKVKTLVLKRGSKGAMVVSGDKRFTALPLSVEVVDPSAPATVSTPASCISSFAKRVSKIASRLETSSQRFRRRAAAVPKRSATQPTATLSSQKTLLALRKSKRSASELRQHTFTLSPEGHLAARLFPSCRRKRS